MTLERYSAEALRLEGRSELLSEIIERIRRWRNDLAYKAPEQATHKYSVLMIQDLFDRVRDIQ